MAGLHVRHLGRGYLFLIFNRLMVLLCKRWYVCYKYCCAERIIGSSLTIRCKLAHKLHVPFKKGGNYDV